MRREKNISVRFAAVGGQTVKAELRDIGSSGRDAMKSIVAGADPASDKLEEVSRAAADARLQLEAIASKAATTARGMKSSFQVTSPVQDRINRSTGVGAVDQQATAAMLAQGQALDDLRAKFNPVFAVLRQYRANLSDLKSAQLSDAISTDEMAAAKGRLRREALAAIDRIKGISAANRESAATAKEASQAVAMQGQRLSDMRAQYNPVFAVIRRYKTEVQGIRTAHMEGALSADEMAAAISRARQASLAQIGAIKGNGQALQGFGKNSEVAQHHVTNLSYQLNDIGMMMASGQNPFMLMIQQGPQVSQIFSTMKAEGRSLGTTIKGAFSMMLNPTTAITMAVIAGSAALGQWVMSAITAGNETRSLSDTVSDLNDVVASVQKHADVAKRSIFDLAQEYGAYAFAVRDSAAALVELERAEVRAAITSAISAARKEVGALGVDIDGLRAKWAAIPAEAMGAGTDAARFAREVANAEEAVKKLAGQLEISETDAAKMAQSLFKLGQARTFDDMDAALRGVRDVMADVGVDAANLPEPIRKAITEWETLNFTVAQSSGAIGTAIASTQGWAGAMASVLGYVNAIGQSISNISGTAIDIAAVRTEREVLRITGDTQKAAIAGARKRVEIEGAAHTAELEKQHGILGRILGRGETAAKQLAISEQESLRVEQEAARERDRIASKAAKGGGGGGKTKEKQEETRASQDLITSLSQELLVLRETDPVKKKMLEYSTQMTEATADERSAILSLVGALDEAQNGWEAVGRGMADFYQKSKRMGSDWAGIWTGAMQQSEQAFANFTATGKLKFSDMVTSIAADIARLAWRQHVTGPLAGWLTGLMGGAFGGDKLTAALASAGAPVSFDGGGHTGYGARFGGLDGKGGFLAMMHPRERVVDETKGQGAGGMRVIATHDPGILLQMIDERAGAKVSASEARQRQAFMPGVRAAQGEIGERYD